MASRRRFLWSVSITPIVVFGLFVAAWALDTSMSSGDVIRNTTVAGRDVGGSTETELTNVVGDLATSYADTSVTINSGDEIYETTAGALGLAIDVEATAANTLAVADDRALPARPFAWLGSIVRPNEVDPVFRVDVAALETELARLEGERRTAPVEPSVVFFLDEVVPLPGEPGMGIDASKVVGPLRTAADRAGMAPFSITADPTVIAPVVDDDAAIDLASTAMDLTAQPIQVMVGDDVVEVDATTQRSWVTSTIVDDTLTTDFDIDLIRESMDDRLSASSEAPIDASFTIDNGVPVVIPGRTGKACCAEDSGDKILEALRSGDREVELTLTEREPDLTTEDAEALGIVAEVGSPDAFGPTTRHACCANRVTNIHRIADIVRGHIIMPGDTFSVNDFVGKRTIEKGFVSDGVIYDGKLTQDVGGGISQFATTTFNAALFAGLDFGEYQSHSLYISRYPRGHEATISFPAPDLQIKNTTPYGVLIWPEYTDTSLTVRLYSTPHADVTLGATRDSRQGNCTRVTTPRTRTYPDGTTVEDSVFALYRPGEGVNC